MKKVLAINFLVEEKEVRKVMAMLTGEAISDEKLESDFFNDPVQIDMNDMHDQEAAMTMAFVAMVADKKGYSN